MNELKPSNQTKLFGLNKYIAEFINLYDNDKLTEPTCDLNTANCTCD